MSSKRILGIAGAAMMGTLAGTGVVNAYITLDAEGAVSGPTFALETLSRAFTYESTDDDDGVTYYEVSDATGSSGETQIRIPIGTEVPLSTDAVVTVDLEDLVIGNLSSTLWVTAATVPATLINLAGITSSAGNNTVAIPALTGGATGDKRVQFGFTTGSGANQEVPATANLVITLGGGRLGVNPDKDGTITVTVTRVFGGASVTEVTTLRGAIKTARALDVTVTPKDQTALVAEGFMKFDASGDTPGVSTTDPNDQLAAHVGNLQIGLQGATSTPPDVFFHAARGATNGQITGASSLVSAATVSLTGQTSFLAEDEGGKKLVYIGSDDCHPVEDSIMNDEGLAVASLNDFTASTGGYFCLKVDGETPIPQTMPYQVSIGYTPALAANAVFPPATSRHTLGQIKRDGATVRIAHLTTNQKYNQRVVIVNRSSGSVDYTTTFQTAAGVDYTPGNGAEGTLRPNSRTILNVRDMVTFDDGNTNADGTPRGGNGSAVLSAAVLANMIEVVTVTTNKEDGSTDTVVWSPE